MQVIAHNMLAQFANRQLNITTNKNRKSSEKLASGYRINRAADDAASLKISEKMRAQIRGLHMAERNIQDGISYCNVADGALSGVHSMLDRMKELSVQAANDTNTSVDREAIDMEVQQLKVEINRTFTDTEYNGQQIWPMPMIPQVSGKPTDFSLYNASDSKGNYIGGIEYMKHRYSWEDLGIRYDRDTQTFLETKEVSCGMYIQDDSLTTADDYKGKYASFSISVKQGAALGTAEKNYSWSISEDGMLIDGVLLDGSDPQKGDTTWTTMGLQYQSPVAAGTYSFMYYGMKVEFDVPKGGVTWEEFEREIMPDRSKLDWHSLPIGTAARDSAVIKSMTNKIVVTRDIRMQVSEKGYDIIADENGMSIRYDHPAMFQTIWQNIKDAGTDSNIGSWGEFEKNHDNMQQVSVDEDALYHFDDSVQGGFMKIDFTLDRTGSSDEILRDLNSTHIYGKVISPVAATVQKDSSITGIAAKTSASAASQMSFTVQRDVFDRLFVSDTENFASGTIVKNQDDKYEITLISANDSSMKKTFSLDKDFDLKKRIADQIEGAKKAYEEKKKLRGEPLIDDDSINAGDVYADFKCDVADLAVTYNLNNICYGDIKDYQDSNDYMNLAEQIIEANRDVHINGDGETYQNLEYRNDRIRQEYVVNGIVAKGGKVELNIQSGPSPWDDILITYDSLRINSLGIADINMLTHESSEEAIALVDYAIDEISAQRVTFGVYTNRLEHAYEIAANNAENTQTAESRLRDTDMAKEVVDYSRDQILMQVAESILTQANQNQNQVMGLLQ